jgi:hypothetical protein
MRLIFWNRSLFLKGRNWVFSIGLFRIGFLRRVNGRLRGFDCAPSRVARWRA